MDTKLLESLLAEVPPSGLIRADHTDTHPVGWRQWMQWRDDILNICARSQAESRNAIAAWDAAR